MVTVKSFLGVAPNLLVGLALVAFAARGAGCRAFHDFFHDNFFHHDFFRRAARFRARIHAGGLRTAARLPVTEFFREAGLLVRHGRAAGRRGTAGAGNGVDFDNHRFGNDVGLRFSDGRRANDKQDRKKCGEKEGGQFLH